MATKICKPQDLQNVVEVGASSTNVISLIGNSLGTTTESRTDLVNSTAATVGAQQYSPSLYMRGSGWKTNATAAAQYCDIQQFVAPFQSTASPLSAWTLQSRVNEGSWTTIMTASQLSINFSLTSYFTENTVFPSNRSVFFNSATDCGFKFSTPQTVDSLLFFLDSI